MRKKFIIGLMISGLAMSVVACGGNEIEKEIGNGIETAIVENDEAMLEETVIEDTEEIEEYIKIKNGRNEHMNSNKQSMAARILALVMVGALAIGAIAVAVSYIVQAL